jgi:probable HAF family extracellular repeat protein
MKRFVLCGFVCFGWCGFFQTIQADPIVPLNYTFTTIDVPGSAFTNLYGINNSGQIVGSYTDSAGAQHGFLYTNGTFAPLPFTPTGINNVGQIVGLSGNNLVFDTNGSITNIAIPGSRGFPSYIDYRLAKINDLGQVAGNYYDQYFGIQGFVYTNGTFTLTPMPIPDVQESVSAHGINNAGQILVTIVGQANSETYLYQNGLYTTLIFPDNFITGIALNNVGQAVGSYPVATYVYTNGVVGYFHLGDNTPYPGEPADINDLGQIVGGDILAAPVPEPGLLLLFTGGLGLLCFLRHRAHA